VSRVSGRFTWLALACLTMFMGFVAAAATSTAQAEETVWICRPGEAHDLCAGTIAGSTMPPPGEPSVPLQYTRPVNPPIDCFYLYPTQSEQPTPNSNLDKDPPIKRVVVQQARMFSSVCKVYAPMYHQVTYSGNQQFYNPDVETAYQSAKAAFEDYLANYNEGRGFIILGHSQGSAHSIRLIDEMIDNDAKLRKRFLGAITPGGNVYVPVGQNVGGMYDNVPACTNLGQLGCMVAYSMYTDNPGPSGEFSRLDYGYWIYPQDRPDSSRYEVMCVNPAELDGSDGTLLPLANFDYLTSVPAEETATPWKSEPDYYHAECKRQDGAHWLNVSQIGLPGETRPNLGSLVGSGINWHVPEVNLAEGNLLKITGAWSADYTAAQERVAKAKAKLKKLQRNLAKSNKRLKQKIKSAKKLDRKARKAKGKRKRTLKRKAKGAHKKATAERKRIKTLKKQISQVKKEIA